jgi:NADH:quinone reductase (non-electrogenic)
MYADIHIRVGVPKLAAAVSEAGGLGPLQPSHPTRFVPGLTCNVWTGILTALTQPSPDALRVAIHETRKLTTKPFGVNITILPSINPPDYEGYARAAVEEGVRIFETAGHNRTFPLCGHDAKISNLP